MTLPIISQSVKSTKAEKDNESVERKGCHYHIQCLVSDTAIPLCPYNHSQQLEGRADGTSTYPRGPTQDEGNYYKKRDRERGRGETPQHAGGIKKGSPNRDKDQFSLMNSVRLNLIVKSTIMIVVHTLKPSSLAHSLQIYCTGLTGLKSHSFWAWPEKRDPTPIITS